MAGRRHRGRSRKPVVVRLSDKSVAALGEEIVRHRSDLAQLKSSIPKLEAGADAERQRNTRYRLAQQRCSNDVDLLNKEKAEIINDKKNHKTKIRCLFTSDRLRPEARARVKEIDEFISEIWNELPAQGETSNVCDALARRRREIEGTQKSLNRLERVLAAKRKRVAREAEEAERRLNRASRLKAAAAQNQDAQRKLVGSIRSKIEKASDCAYCGTVLGTACHLNHIYPVSKGGHSTPRNLVWVCVGCNQMKRDMTLAQFIKACGMNREIIEERLATLKKDY